MTTIAKRIKNAIRNNHAVGPTGKVKIEGFEDFCAANPALPKQLVVSPWMIQRLVFYDCEIFADQLRSGDGYEKLRPAFTICLVQGQLWPGDQQVQHAFKFADAESSRVLDRTLEFHTLEMGK